MTATDLTDQPLIDWSALSSEEIHATVRDAFDELAAREAEEPSDGVLDRSVALDNTLRAGPAYGSHRLSRCDRLPREDPRTACPRGRRSVATGCHPHPDPEHR